MKITYNIYLFVKKFFEEKHVDLWLIEEEGKRHYVLIKEFDTFMYDYTLHRGRKHFCLQAFSIQKNVKMWMTKILKKVNTLDSKTMKGK